MIFLLRTYTKTAIVIFLLLGIGFVAWARTGFTLDLFRSQAAVDQPQKKTPWLYCDYATKSCKPGPVSMVSEAQTAVGGTDYDAPLCSGKSDGTACIPGDCRKWEGGDATSWRPVDTPANVPACEPLSEITAAAFPGYSGTPISKPPITFPTTAADPNCFVVEDRSSHDPNFGSMTENAVPEILRDNPTAKLFMRAFVVNNCPWTVHYVLQTDVSKKAINASGAGKRECGISPADGAKLTTMNMPDSFDFPSCWNNGQSMTPANCAREIKIEFNLNTFTCGSVGITTAIWHRVQNNAGGGQTARAERGGALQYATQLNYGRDCTGSAVERAPQCGGSTGGGGGTGGSTCVATKVPAPAKLTVQCGATQNVLTWTNETNACQASILRNVDGGNGTFLSGTPAFPARTFTDRNIQAGHSYTYRIKNHPAVTSNAVTCKNGVSVTTPPSPGTSSSPVPTTGASPTPIGSVAVSPTPTVIGVGNPPTPMVIVDPNDDDLDDDGILNDRECPGYVAGSDPMICPDSDGDGVPDILDTDSDNDGIPDSQDCNRLGTNASCGAGVGGVQTGPGDATLLALIISAIVSLAYVSYTHSPVGKRREVEVISKDQGPMNFRN